MILKTVKKLSLLLWGSPIDSIRAKIYSYKCIKSYAIDFKSHDTLESLKQLCFACASYDKPEVETDLLSFKCKFDNIDDNEYTINITYKRDIKLSIKIINEKMHMQFSNNSYSYFGEYDSPTCSNSIKYEIDGVLIATFVEVLNVIFDLTPMYNYVK